MTPEQQAAYNKYISMGIPAERATALAMQVGGGSSSSAEKDPPVYMGQFGEQSTWGDKGSAGQWTGGSNETSSEWHQGSGKMLASEAIYFLQDKFQQNDPLYFHTKALMVKAGMIPDTATLGTVLSQWAGLVAIAADSTARGGKFDPWFYLEKAAGENGAGSGGSRVTSTSTSTQDPTNQKDLEAMYQQISGSTSGLGRRAREDELKPGTAGAHALDVANPGRSTSTTTTTDGVSHTSSRSTPGVTQAGLAEEMQQQVMSSKDYGAYQAAGIYFPALLQALAATANVQ